MLLAICCIVPLIIFDSERKRLGSSRIVYVLFRDRNQHSPSYRFLTFFFAQSNIALRESLNVERHLTDRKSLHQLRTITVCPINYFLKEMILLEGVV